MSNDLNKIFFLNKKRSIYHIKSRYLQKLNTNKTSMKTKFLMVIFQIYLLNVHAQKLFQPNFIINQTTINPNPVKATLRAIQIRFADSQGITHHFSDSLYFSEDKIIDRLPTFAKDPAHYYLAITDEKSNGYLYTYDVISEKFDKHILFTDEPTWTKTFFGKAKNGNPYLYHIDSETNFIYQSYLKNGKWKIHRTFPLNDKQLEDLYAEQSLYSSAEKPNTFDVDMDLDDPYFQLLEWKAELENNPKYYKEGAIHYPKKEGDGPFVVVKCTKDEIQKEYDLIEIQNMPPIKTQDTMGDCRAFSLAAVIQKFICDNTKPKDPNENITKCNPPPPERAISYFGMMIYTNSILANAKTLQPNQKDQIRTDSIIAKITDASDGFVLESCKPFDQFTANFSFYNNSGDKKAMAFLSYTKQLYDTLGNTDATAIKDCPECLEQLSNMTGFEANAINLKQALSKKSYDEFLFTLLFADCKLREVSRGFRQITYPQETSKVSNEDLKNRIKQGLNANHPVLFPYLCLESKENGNDCKYGHSVVISGFKKICCGDKCTDLFKVHNSWGQDWQDRNKGGWVSADNLLNQTQREYDPNTKEQVVTGGSVIWLE